MEIVNRIFDGFTDTPKKGERIEIRGFGSFAVREYGAYNVLVQREMDFWPI